MTEYDDHGRARINVDISGAVEGLTMVSEMIDVLAAAAVKAFRNAETQSILSGLNSTIAKPDWGHDPLGLMNKLRLENNYYPTWAEMLHGFADWIEELICE